MGKGKRIKKLKRQRELARRRAIAVNKKPVDTTARFFPIFYCEGMRIFADCEEEITLACNTKDELESIAKLRQKGWAYLENPHRPGTKATLCPHCIKVFRKQKQEFDRAQAAKEMKGLPAINGRELATEMPKTDPATMKADLARNFELALEEWKQHKESCPSCSKVHQSQGIEDCAKICGGANAMKLEQIMLKRMLNKAE